MVKCKHDWIECGTLQVLKNSKEKVISGPGQGPPGELMICYRVCRNCLAIQNQIGVRVLGREPRFTTWKGVAAPAKTPPKRGD